MRNRNIILPSQKTRHLSAFMKIFGNEMQFMQVKQEFLDRVAQDLSDLLYGQKTRLDYPNQGKN